MTPPSDGRAPAVEMDSLNKAAIRETLLTTMPSAWAFGHISAIAMVFMFWQRADQTGLVVWTIYIHIALLVTSQLAKRASKQSFFRAAILGEVLTSAGWGLVPVIALATTPDWQAFQGAILVGLTIATLATSTGTIGLHLASTMPVSLISALAFTVQGDGSARWLGMVLVLIFAFTLSSGAVLRQVQLDLFESTRRAEQLAAKLIAEGDRLQEVNGRLATANQDLDSQSRLDPLTGLYNRDGFTTLLTEALEKNPGRIAVCYLDLDGFKQVNDAFGHRFGDLVLLTAARRISSVLLPGEVFARQGGDELTVFGSFESLNDGGHSLGERLLQAVEEPFLIEGRSVEIAMSIGIAAIPEPASPDDLMRFADAALYRAKELGGRRYEVSTAAMRQDLDTQTQLQTDLSQALARFEISPYLQPIVDLQTGQIVGAEALARWEHPDGLRTANQFIQAAKNLGIIDRVNDIVVAQIRAFQEQRGRAGLPTCRIAVNVSPLHFEAMLNRVTMPTTIDQITIEITEDGIFADLERARALIDRATLADVKILLDDFGVGFSSLSIATQLPVDGFKIDRAFVASLEGNPSAHAAVEAIVQLAARMDLYVVAEGAETLAQLRLLGDLGIRYVQGFVFSRAVTQEQFGTWLDTDHRFAVGEVASV